MAKIYNPHQYNIKQGKRLKELNSFHVLIYTFIINKKSKVKRNVYSMLMFMLTIEGRFSLYIVKFINNIDDYQIDILHIRVQDQKGDNFTGYPFETFYLCTMFIYVYLCLFMYYVYQMSYNQYISIFIYQSPMITQNLEQNVKKFIHFLFLFTKILISKFTTQCMCIWMYV